MREITSMIAGRSLDAAALILKGLEKDYGTPCIDCRRKRRVVMDSVFPPTPDKDKCHDCCQRAVPA